LPLPLLLMTSAAGMVERMVVTTQTTLPGCFRTFVEVRMLQLVLCRGTALSVAK